jgi:hypothetical protein
MAKSTHAMNPQQIAVAEAHAGGEFAYIIRKANWRSDLPGYGDSMFVYLMKELSTDQDCFGDEDALRLLRAAKLDIETAIDAINVRIIQATRAASAV